MGAYTVTLKERREVAESTMAFLFDKPAGFEFAAGQSADVTLLNPPETDTEGNTRAFSLASAPWEPDLMFATRLRDTAFKHLFRTMPLGTEIKIYYTAGPPALVAGMRTLLGEAGADEDEIRSEDFSGY